MKKKEQLYYQMLLIRRFEEHILKLFSKGELFGSTHAYIGQEANAVAVLQYLQKDDIVVSNHRCHGHYLARTEDVEGLMAELMGKAGGVCGGRGGSQHLCKNGFYTNGILGSTVPIAAGMAFAEKKKKSNNIAVLFMGDGAFGEGPVYETFNMISLWQVPLLIVVENNRYAQSTPLHINCAGSFVERARAFHLSAGEIETNDVEELYNRFDDIVKMVREESMPHVEILHTFRLCSHSKNDDFRPAEEIESWREKDPLKILGERISQEVKQKMEKEVFAILDKAEALAKTMPFPSLNK